MQAMQGKVRAARQQYVEAMKTYLTGLTQALSTGSSGTMQQALTQLHIINTTLAHAVQTEMTAQKAQASSGPDSGASALSDVTAKFQAELTALQQATVQVQALTTNVQSTSSTSTSPS
jgi:hypothetical protein